MDKHPIESLMETAMNSIKQMVEVNTIVGDAVETADGTVIIPVTKVSCGFAAGGSEIVTRNNNTTIENAQKELPFGGGSGGGVSVQPVGFLVVSKSEVRFLVVDNNAIMDRLIGQVPNLLQQVQGVLGKNGINKSGQEINKETIVTKTTTIEQ